MQRLCYYIVIGAVQIFLRDDDDDDNDDDDEDDTNRDSRDSAT